MPTRIQIRPEQADQVLLLDGLVTGGGTGARTNLPPLFDHSSAPVDDKDGDGNKEKDKDENEDEDRDRNRTELYDEDDDESAEMELRADYMDSQWDMVHAN